MDKEVAAALMTLSKSLDEIIAKMFAEAGRFSDDDMKSRFNKAIGDLMGQVARDLIFPLENAFPELKANP
jgi:hypothetical protein